MKNMIKIKDLLKLLGINISKKVRKSESALVREVANSIDVDYPIIEERAKGNLEGAYQLCMEEANRYRKAGRKEHSNSYYEMAIWLLEECAREIKERRH